MDCGQSLGDELAQPEDRMGLRTVRTLATAFRGFRERIAQELVDIDPSLESPVQSEFRHAPQPILIDRPELLQGVLIALPHSFGEALRIAHRVALVHSPWPQISSSPSPEAGRGQSRTPPRSA